MFAGEGDAFRTNKRFRMLSEHADSKRLSTAFDSVTLYGFDPHERPDIYGKVGNSGVSIATIEDMKALYDGFDLCDAGTSVSMTINGPAPVAMALFLNTAIDQQVEKFSIEQDCKPNKEQKRKDRLRKTMEEIGPGLMDESVDFIKREEFDKGSPGELKIPLTSEQKEILEDVYGVKTFKAAKKKFGNTQTLWSRL